MTDNLSPDARDAREAARVNGQFGEQQRTSPEVSLTTAVNDANGHLVTVTVPEFTPAYPVEAFGFGEVARSDGESVECVCGNDTSGDGFGQAGADGRYADLRLDGQDPELSSDDAFFICHVCGRVYHGASAVAAGDGGLVPVVAKYARGPEFDAARGRYWAALDA